MAALNMIPILILLFPFTFDVSNSIKWYFYNSRTTHHSQKRYEDLWNYGCCQNTIECQGEGPKYLGMDVFMRLRPDLLMIHQVNYMESKTFGLDYLPSEISIGRIGKDTDKDNYWGLKLHEWCPHGDSKESPFITGFSVPNIDKGFLVCGDIVLFIRWHDRKIMNSVNRKEHCICQDNPPANCRGLHPVFCDSDPYKLMSIAAVPTKVSDSNPYLYGFYSNHSKHETGKTPRKYIVKVWRKDRATKEPIHSTSSTGYLTEVDTFKEDATGYYGMYFTNDGNACPFNGTYADDAKIKDQSDLTFEYLKTPRKPCLSFQIFIGCPQPWCFSNRFDASFTVPDINNKDILITFAVGNFAWTVKDTHKLPLKPPRVEEANKPINIRSSVGSAFPCRIYLKDKDMVSCAIPNIGAAVAFKPPKSTNWSIVYYSTSKHRLYIELSAWWPSAIPQNENFRGDNINTKHWYFDAFWNNEKEKAFYSFQGRNYEKYSYERKFVGVFGKLFEFHIEAPLVDAVVNRENKGYFFYNNFYYEVPEDNWRNQASLSKIFAMENFFDVRKECYANDNEAYEKLISRFIQQKITVNKTAIGDVILITRNTQEPSTKAPRSRMYMFYIIIPGILIVLGTVVCMFTFGTMAGRKGRTKSISKVKKSKALPTGSPSVKSSPKTPSNSSSKRS